MARVIVGVNAASERFLRSLDRVKDPKVRREILDTVRSLLLLDLDKTPAKLHLHPLKNKEGASILNPMNKVPIWTIHVTADDVYKASFTFENGTAYLRCIRTHDDLDKDP